MGNYSNNIKKLEDIIKDLEVWTRNMKDSFKDIKENNYKNTVFPMDDRARDFYDVEISFQQIDICCKKFKKVQKELAPYFEIIDYEAPEKFYAKSIKSPVRRTTARKTTRRNIKRC